MSETVTETAVVEQPTTEQPEPAPLSVMEHAKLHGEAKDKLPAEEKTALEEKAAHHSEAQKREKDGKFTEGRTRHRAQSQQARPEDVPRIRELTARAKGAEERLSAAEAELTRLRAERAPAAQIQQAERKVEQAETHVERVTDPKDPEPEEDDPKFENDYGKYLEAKARWAARDEHRQVAARQKADAETAKQREAEQNTLKGFGERVTAAKAEYGADYDETLRWDVPWLQKDGTPYANGVAIDRWVMTHKTGAHMLHFLRQHPDEVNSLAELEPFEQIERLALLSQRFTKTPETAGSTGAATRPVQVKLPPRPATPVRTEAMSVGGPPPTDGTLSVMDHAKKFKRA